MLCTTWIVQQQVRGYKVEEKLRLGVREQKKLNTAVVEDVEQFGCL
jgi:hypothetical protein